MNGCQSSEEEPASADSRLVERAVHWCLVNGFVVVPREHAARAPSVVTYLPFNLFPTPFARDHYRQVCHLQPRLNELVHKLASEPARLEAALDNLTKTDAFIAALWNVFKRAQTDGFRQRISFTIIRCDYMLHEAGVGPAVMKQVEINTIAAGFGYASTRVAQLHREVLKWAGRATELSALPENKPVVGLAAGFVQAWRLYGRPEAVVIFVVLDVEVNIADQRHLEYEIERQEPGIVVHRCTLKEIQTKSRMDDDKILYYENAEVAVVYFRAGYAPEHYTSQDEWDALLRIESSRAVKCPSLGAFLAGMKKIQEYLAVENNLAELCNRDAELVASFQAVFAQFLRLDDPENFRRVLEHPGDFVLKPQREGGGNNFYDEKITEVLTKIRDMENNNRSDSEQSSIYSRDCYIAMERLRPAVSRNFLISPKGLSRERIEITNELGVYGVHVQDGEDVIMNEIVGYCLRSKPACDYEGGVMCGSGALDSLYLVN